MPQIQGQRLSTNGMIYPIIPLNPTSFINARVAPGTNQHAEQSTLYIQPRNTAGTFVGNAFINVGNLNGAAQWAQIATSGGAGVFSSLTVTPGPISLTGITNINTSGTAVTSIGTGTNTGGVLIGNNTAGQAVSIVASATGGLTLSSAGHTSLDFQSGISASPTATVVINGRQAYATFTGFTTAAAASQVFVITNSSIVIGSAVSVTANNLGSNDAQMTVTRVQTGAGTISITLKNNGAAALNGDVNLTVIAWD